MTDSTDALVGTVGGLMALGITAGVASKMMNNQRARLRRKKMRKIRFI